MRLAPALFATLLAGSGAHAADYLRGPISAEPPRAAQTASVDWSGTYLGLQGIWNNATFNQGNLGNRAAASAFPNTGAQNLLGSLLMFGNPHVTGGGFGGFAGYNIQFDDVVMGVELDYNRGGLKAGVTSPTVARAVSAGTASATSTVARLWDTTLGGRAETRLQDVTALKARVGFAVDRFLPYLAGGVVVARVASQTTTTGQTQLYELQPITDPVTSQITGYQRINLTGVFPGSAVLKDQGWRWGYQVGAGVDWALTDGIFVRGAWDYSQFGTGGVQTGVHAFKGGAAVKF